MSLAIAKRVSEKLKEYSPLFIATALLVTGFLITIVGLLGLLFVDDSQKNWITVFQYLRDFGFTIVASGVLAAVFRIMFAVNFVEELFDAFVMSDKVLERRSDLAKVWLTVTRFFYLRGHSIEGSNLAEDVEDCLRRSLLREGNIFIRDIVQEFRFEWSSESTEGGDDGLRRGILFERTEMKISPLTQNRDGNFKTTYEATSGEDIGDYKFELIKFKYDAPDGPDVECTFVETSEGYGKVKILEARISEERRYYIERRYEWDVESDPFMSITWPCVAKNYRLSLRTSEPDVKTFFVAEGHFNDLQGAEDREREPATLVQVCDGIILPSQSHTVIFQIIK